MSRRIVVAIDDTDMPGTRGTGRLARMLADEVVAAGLGTSLGVTRHQFWVGPGVPMTSHNSAAALMFESDRDAAEFEAFARDVLAREFIEGSDPGLAVLERRAPGVAVAFARRAQNGLVTRDEAERIASMASIRLLGLAGTRDGMIGALSAATLRFEGNDGRFVGLPGIRDLLGRMRVAEIYAAAPVDLVLDEETGTPLSDDAMVDTGDWVRPRLMEGRAVVVVRRTDEAGVWVNVDRRMGHED